MSMHLLIIGGCYTGEWLADLVYSILSLVSQLMDHERINAGG